MVTELKQKCLACLPGQPQGKEAYAVAEAILNGFNKHYKIFRECSRRTKSSFENQDWQSVSAAVSERTKFYDQRVRETADQLASEFGAGTLGNDVWQSIKMVYIGLLINHKQPELAETFFNSVCTNILHRTFFHNDFIFVRPAVSTEHIESDPPAYRSYYPLDGGLRTAIRKLIHDFDLKTSFANLERDIRYVLKVWRHHLPKGIYLTPNHQIQVLSSLFYRNKAAYMVGKVINGNEEYPFMVPILHDEKRLLYLDTIVLNPEQLNIMFSSNRAYFLVDMEVPSAFVQFLQSIMPGQRGAELYTVLGLQKQGKNLFYRDFLHHLKHSSDKFIIAPGVKGMVMSVFTLPSYPYVFKVIKDVILPPKEVTREIVKRKYLLVKLHDRVGRMADTLEYSDVAFPKARFTEELLNELRTLAPSILVDEGDTILIKHLYIERRMKPLNLYLYEANAAQIDHAMLEYGKAIKQLAAANIFAGDLLFKNFGVTRYDRVVFYDYDEIEYMTDCNFRYKPLPRNEEDEMAAEPWYSIDPMDVFPEEFETFLLTDPKVKASFMRYHANLLDAKWWQDMKKRVAQGQMEDVFPYPESMRFINMYGSGRERDATS